MGDSLEALVVYLMPPDKSVGIGLRVLVCVCGHSVLYNDVVLKQMTFVS